MYWGLKQIINKLQKKIEKLFPIDEKMINVKQPSPNFDVDFTQNKILVQGMSFLFFSYASKMKQVFSIIDPFQIYFRPDTYIICFNMIQQGKKMYFPIFISLFVYGKERQNRFT